MRRSLIASGLLAALACVVPSGATADDVRTVRSATAAGRDCAEPAPDGAAGIARREWTAPADGLLTARLEGGPAPDWDLAVFRDGKARAAGASTSSTSDERADAWVSAGERLTIQSCRLDGAPRVPLSLDLLEIDRPGPPAERTSLESVAISDSGELAVLESFGVDVADVAPGAATAVLYSDAERALLAAAGFETRTLIADLAAHNDAQRQAERQAARGGDRSALPSGRDTYRLYADYTTELKALADDNPGLVRSIVLGQTVDGRPIEGVEIAADVERTDDGRPVYLNMGAHHAREWPSAEYPMEFAIDLVDGFNADDARITALLEQVRVVIVPVVNVDGFIVSRETVAGENRRKNCRPTLGDALVPCASRSTFSGVDLNRNYGAYWGGPGSSGQVTSDSYRGPGPFSEPESQAVHQYTSGIHPTVFITNHTFTEDGKWLRQPGFDDVVEVTPDEAAMKSLGDSMAAATGWTSELGYETLGDITGATEDWNYFAQGTYGYTPEARGPSFHDNYADMVVEEYLGDATHSGLGVREAFLRAGEVAADPDEHSVVAGSAPPGADLGLRKQFGTPTSQAQVVNEVLDTELDVPSSGEYEWQVNPSSRPLVAGEVWTMSCTAPGGAEGTAPVAVDRGQRVQVDWSAACAASIGARGRCAGARATIAGTDGRDKLRGTSRRDVIVAGGGRDKVRAGGGNDVVCGGSGKDKLRGGAGRDTLKGGGGKDRCRGGPGRDKLRGC